MSSSITNMPLDMWREILVRVPAESVIRLKAVCKGWRAVVDDPCFVRAHTNNHQHQLSSSKIIFQNLPSQSAAPSLYSLDLEALISCSSNGHHAINIAATPHDLDFVSDKLSLPVAECNGLVLTEKPLTIWNPLTHERLDLPPARDFSKTAPEAFGLGYDGTTDDYKAVAILRNRQTHVYSLRLDSWRRIKTNCPPCDPVGPGVFACGGLNWLSADDDKNIVVLDLGTEKYSLLQMPRDQTTRALDEMLLDVLGGCLALCVTGFKSHLDVWVMKAGSWDKLLSIDWKPNISKWRCVLRPVAFIMKKEKLIVFLKDSCDRFFLFDVETKSMKSVEIDGSIIREDSYWYAKQMFVGTIFRLHANCGGGERKIATSTSTKKKKKASSSAAEVVEQEQLTLPRNFIMISISDPNLSPS